jgi:CobQ-like glutamine amidotransferase family enzyme
MGGAQDSQQKLVAEDLMQKKSLLATHIEDGKPGLFICGAYQFLGTYYKEADGTVIPGLGIFDIHTIHPGTKSKRLVGNLLADSTQLLPHAPLETIVGFENHGGRTYLGDNCTLFASVKKGYGNNGEDKTEGAVLKNSIGSYCHGPLLPKNPHVADFLIQKALEKKYNTSITLSALDDSLSYSAHHLIAKRM